MAFTTAKLQIALPMAFQVQQQTQEQQKQEHTWRPVASWPDEICQAH